MRQTASPIRTANHRAATRRVLILRRILSALLLLLPVGLFLPAAHAQTPYDLGMTYTQQLSKFVGSPPHDTFYLRGATVDFSSPVYHGIGPVVSLTGLAATNLRTSIDIHQASFTFGGRYTYTLGHISPTVWSRHGSIFAEGLVGITYASDGLYPSPTSNVLTSTATGFTYALGGGVNYTLYHRFELRVMSHYFTTELPNGGTKQQRNVQLSAGVNWHFGN